MKVHMRTVVCFVWMMAVASQAEAQRLELVAQPLADILPNRYVTFPIDANYEGLLKRRLQKEKQLGSLRNLVKQFAADPTKLQLDPAQLKDLKLDDVELKTLIQDLTANDPDFQRALRDWIKQDLGGNQPQAVEQLQKKLQTLLDQTPPKISGRSGNIRVKPPPATNGPPIASQEDSLAKFTENAMNQVKNTQIGEWLRDSPSWKSAFAGLQNAMKNPGGPGTDLGKWSDKLLMPDIQGWQLSEKLLERMRNMPRPKMDRLGSNLTQSAIRLIPPSSQTGPVIPNIEAGEMPSLGRSFSWLILAALVILVAWQLLRIGNRSGVMQDDRAELGAWPVRPEAVATRAELIHAFNYLAMLTLGKHVTSWNHQAVALCWSERLPSCAPIVATLADLYEKARYTPGPEPLSDAQRDLARQCLLGLAETF